MRIILIDFAVITAALLFSYRLFKFDSKEDFKFEKQAFNWQAEYNKLVSYIKEHEGFRANWYKCPAGYPTIGYGHLIQDGENHYYEKTLSESEATAILKSDLDKAISIAKKMSPNIGGGKLLAIGHFIFAKGCGRYERSNLRKLVNSNADINLISGEMMKWVTYKRPSGEIVVSENAKKIQKYNIRLYSL